MRKTILAICCGILGATTMLWSQVPQAVAVRAGRLFDSKSGSSRATGSPTSGPRIESRSQPVLK